MNEDRRRHTFEDVRRFKQGFSVLVNRWRRVNIPIHLDTKSTEWRWTPLAFKCLMIRRDCNQCSLKRQFKKPFGFSYKEEYHCHMPYAVQALINEGTTPKWYQLETALEEFGVLLK